VTKTPLRRVLGASLATWTLVLLLHVAASYSDMLRRGTPVPLRSLLSGYLLAYVPWVVYTTVLFPILERFRARLVDWRVVARLYLASLILFLLPESAWQVAATIRNAADPVAAFGPALSRWPAELWLLDLALMTGAFVAIYAIVALREGRAIRERQKAADRYCGGRSGTGVTVRRRWSGWSRWPCRRSWCAWRVWPVACCSATISIGRSPIRSGAR